MVRTQDGRSALEFESADSELLCYELNIYDVSEQQYTNGHEQHDSMSYRTGCEVHTAQRVHEMMCGITALMTATAAAAVPWQWCQDGRDGDTRTHHAKRRRNGLAGMDESATIITPVTTTCFA